MAHKLATIAVIGLATSAVCMGAAAAIGGPSFADGFEGMFDNRPRCQTLTDATATSRELEWDGHDSVSLEVPSQASYSPSNGDRLHATGDPQILAHLRIKDGDIELDCRGWHDRAKNLQITLPGREFRKFAIAGGGGLTLDGLNQTAATIKVEGSGKVRANGKVGDLKMEIEGSGDADFSQIVARHAKIEIEGSNVRSQPQAALQEAGCGREGIVGRLRAEQDEVDRLRIHVIVVEKPRRCLDRQIAGALALSGDVAGRDAGFLVD